MACSCAVRFRKPAEKNPHGDLFEESFVGSTGVTLGPDGVPRGSETLAPIGEPGTRALPDGSLQTADGEAVSQEDIDAANDPSAALQDTVGSEADPSATREVNSKCGFS